MPFLRNGKWGFIDPNGHWRIAPRFSWALEFQEGLAVVLNNGHWSHIDEQGSIQIEGDFQRVESFSDGVAAAKLNGKWGYIDKRGVWIIEPKFEKALEFEYGMAAVKFLDESSLVYINKSGEPVISTAKDCYAEKFSEGVVPLCTGSCAFVDPTGEKAIPLEFQNAEGFSEGLAGVELDDEIFFIDHSGKTIMRPTVKPDRVGSFSEGFVEARKDNKWSFIDLTGNILLDYIFENVAEFSEGLAAVELNEKYGYIDKKGSLVIKPQFQSAEKFHDGIAHVDWENKWGYIDRKGKNIAIFKSNKINEAEKTQDIMTWLAIYLNDFTSSNKQLPDSAEMEKILLKLKHLGINDIVDAWGTKFLIDWDPALDQIRMISAGADRTFNQETWSREGPSTDVTEDIIYIHKGRSGEYVRHYAEDSCDDCDCFYVSEVYRNSFVNR
jgi:hypothetical protein